MTVQDPFHEGERAVQDRAGESARAEGHSGMIAGAVPAAAAPFIAAQGWAVGAGADPEGRLWSSAWLGAPGFARAETDGRVLTLDLRQAALHWDNPLRPALAEGAGLGLLFIDLAQRRRLRVNGRIAETGPERLRLEVREAFPNCPQFIRKRTLEGLRAAPGPARESASGSRLGPEQRAWIAAADTLFLATTHPGRGFDASHRGGPAGFVEVLDEATLRLPDYPGNGLFNSFGNLEVDPRIGLLLPSFADGGLLHLSGTARVLWGAADPGNLTLGSGRFLEISLQRWRQTPD